MIDLTPLDVRKKKGDFRRVVRGYDPGQVDDFLDLIAERLEELVRRNMELTERSTQLERHVAENREREKALTEALVTAQEFREDLQRQAAREAELLRREAEAEAERIRNAAVQEREGYAAELRRLRARREQFLRSYRAFLERELAEIAVATGALELESGDEEADPARRGAAAREPTPVAGEEKVDTARWITELLEEDQK